jgi:hypothetical protein
VQNAYELAFGGLLLLGARAGDILKYLFPFALLLYILVTDAIKDVGFLKKSIKVQSKGTSSTWIRTPVSLLGGMPLLR